MCAPGSTVDPGGVLAGVVTRPPFCSAANVLLAPMTSAGPVALLEQRGRPGDHFG